MAEQWIKVRHGLFGDPRLSRMKAALGISKNEMLGLCIRLWTWADLATADGFIEGMTPELVDEEFDMPGLSEAMVAVRWLMFTENGVVVVNFEDHNGESAKKRAGGAKRAQKSRMKRDKSARKALPDEDEEREEEEEEKKNPPTPLSDFDPDRVTASERYEQQPKFVEFWNRVPTPKRRNRNRTRESFIREIRQGRDPTFLADRMEAYYASEEGRSQYARSVARWLDEEGYDEPDEAWERGSAVAPSDTEKAKAALNAWMGDEHRESA